MTFRIMATVPVVIMAAAVNCGCSAVPSVLQTQNTYSASGQVATAQAAPARVSYTATSPTVEVPGERVVGADPDANVRFDLARNAGVHLHGSGN